MEEEKVILIDKPIPEYCDYCFCNNDDRCGLLNEGFPLHFSGRLPNCPLREMGKVDDLISRQAAIDAVKELCEHYTPTKSVKHPHMDFVIEELQQLPSAQPERKKPRWIPVSPETLPEHNRVVIAYDGKGTWDYGMYRGHMSDIHDWNWKKNTVKYVLYWMYKEDALPSPFEHGFR